MPYNEPIENPYDTESPDLEPQTLPLDEIIRQAIAGATMKLHVMLPATVTSVLGNQKVNIQLNLKTRQRTGVLVDPAAIQNVPVSMPMGANYSIKLPVAVGDTGYVVFCDRSIDAWISGDGSIVDPQDIRQHNISDAVFVPGLVPFSQQTTDDSQDFVITNGEAVFKIQPGGTFIFTNGTNELVDLLSQITSQVQELAATLSTDTVNTIFGPTQLNAFATYQDISTQLSELLTKLNTLKGS